MSRAANSISQPFSLGRCRRVILVVATALLASCSTGVLDPAGPVAAAERTILLNSLAIMLAIIVPIIVLTLVFAWWFRASNTRARHLPDWEYSGRLELLVWSIPVLVIIFLGGITWIGSHDLAPREPLRADFEPVEIEVVAMDWKWLFIYPEQGVASINRLVVPVGAPLSFHITSATVMNSFFIPQLGSQIYAMAGMTARLNLLADRAGSYRGISAHYSGEGFADMQFVVEAVAPDAFGEWVAQTKEAGPVLDSERYLALARTSATSDAYTFRAVTESLFQAIVEQSGAPVHETAKAGRER